MTTVSFDGLDLRTAPYRVRDGVAFYTPAPLGHVAVGRGTRPGGVISLGEPGLRAVPLVIGVEGSDPDDWEANLDTLLTTITRPRRTLIAGHAADRSVTATLMDEPTVSQISRTYGEVACTFLSEDAYWSALTPSGYDWTPTLASAGSGKYTASRAYSVAGSAPAPVRWVVRVETGSVTPLLIQIANVTTGRALASAAVVAAEDALVLDPGSGRAWVVPDSDVTGWFPGAGSFSTEPTLPDVTALEDWRGGVIEFDPREGATNTIELSAWHGTTAPDLRLSASWRTRYR